jgi:hypothetical protein
LGADHRLQNQKISAGDLLFIGRGILDGQTGVPLSSRTVLAAR